MDELLSLFKNGGDESNVFPRDAAGCGGGGGGGTMPSSHRRANESDRPPPSFGSAFPPGDLPPSSHPRAATDDGDRRRAAARAASAATDIIGGCGADPPPLSDIRIVDRRTSRAALLDAMSTFVRAPCCALASASRAEWNSRYAAEPNGDDGGGGGGGGGKTRVATWGVLTSDVTSRVSARTGRAYAIMSLGDMPGGGGRAARSSFENEVRPSVTVFLFGDALSILRPDVVGYVKAGCAVAVLGPNLMPPQNGAGGGGTTTSVTLSVDDPRRILPVGKAADCARCRGTMRKRTAAGDGSGATNRWEDSRCNTLVDTRLFGGYCAAHRRQGLLSSSTTETKKIERGGTTAARRAGGNGGGVVGAGGTFMQRQRLFEGAAAASRAGATMATTMGGGGVGGVGGVGGKGRGVPPARADAARRGGVVVRATMSSSSSSSRPGIGEAGGMMGTSSSLSEALSRSGLLGPESQPPPSRPTTFSSTASSSDSAMWSSSSSSSSRPPPPPPLLALAPLHMKKMPNGGGGTTATAATGRNPYSKEKNRGGREDSNAIADPAKRRRRSAGNDDDVLGEALERTKKRTRRSSGPSPAGYDDGPPSRDGGGRLPIVKVFNVGGYDGSVQVPKPSAILFRRTSTIALHTAVTPSPRDHRAQPSAAILERQMHLAELLRREGGDAAGCASSTTTAGARAARTTNATVSSGGNPSSRRNDGRGDFASTFGGVAAAADDDDGRPAGRSSSALERIASARSRFASAVDAREYARARGAVQALEAREESSTTGDKQKNYNANEKKKDGLPVVAKNAIVTSGWSCRSCKKTTPFKPASCIRAGHDVRQRRELKEEGRRSANSSSLGSRKDRLDRHGRDDEEGGLTLGSGLEWSGWRGGFD